MCKEYLLPAHGVDAVVAEAHPVAELAGVLRAAALLNL